MIDNKNIERLLNAGAFLFTALPNKKHNAEPGGFKNSFNNLQELNKWTDEHPRYKGGNTGIDLSKGTLVVLDIDKHEKNGYIALVNYLNAQGLDPKSIMEETYSELTPSGGLHLFYQWATDKPKPVRTVGLLDGVDWLTDGGVIVAPSDIDGKSYKPLHQEGEPFAISPVPEWLSKLMNQGKNHSKAKSYKSAKTTQAERWGMVVDGFETGQRNEQATSFIGGLLACRVDPSKAFEIMQAVNTNSVEPLPDSELLHVYRSVLKRDNERLRRLIEQQRAEGI